MGLKSPVWILSSDVKNKKPVTAKYQVFVLVARTSLDIGHRYLSIIIYPCVVNVQLVEITEKVLREY